MHHASGSMLLRAPTSSTSSSSVARGLPAAPRHTSSPRPAGRRGVAARAGGEGSSSGGEGGGKKAERVPWDVQRFASTVFFFKPPGELVTSLLTAPIRAVAGLLSANAASASSSSSSSSPLITLLPASGSSATAAAGAAAGALAPPGVVLVTGATGGVGKRVVERLLQNPNQVVRALVRDVAKARALLGALPTAPGAALQLAPADLTQRRTLTPELLDGVRAVVSCSAVKVAPKEGDTPDRAKYMQGIKFFDPEVIGDTPETVELKGLQNLLDALGGRLGFEAGAPVLSADAASAARWGALDDVVMGGASESSMVFSREGGEGGGPALVFRGNVSTANSGGFVSVRCRNFEPPLDLGAYRGLRLRVRGSGLRYKLILRTSAAWDGVGFCRSFDTREGEWHDVALPFDEFVPVFRARTVRDGGKTRLDPSRVCSAQLMLSKFEYDGALNPSFRAGPSELAVGSITAYLAEPVAPRFVHISSAGVTRPNRPGINVDQEPPAVKLNDALGGILTYKLAGEDAVRASGIPFAVVRPTALTEEPAGMPLEFDQGDVVKGKVGRADVADLAVALLSAPAARDCTFEVKSTVPFSQPWAPEAPAPPRDWAAELAAARLRPGVTGRTVGGVYTGRDVEAEALEKAGAAAPAATTTAAAR